MLKTNLQKNIMAAKVGNGALRLFHCGPDVKGKPQEFCSFDNRFERSQSSPGDTMILDFAVASAVLDSNAQENRLIVSTSDFRLLVYMLNQRAPPVMETTLESSPA